jgi:hypothetical protein
MSLASKVAEVYSDVRVARIDFYLGALHVDASGLKKVGEAITGSKICIVEGSTGKRLSGGYSPHNDQLTLPKGVDPALDKWKVVIVHEGVHALVDMAGKKAGLTVLDEEAAAYLAEVVFMKAAYQTLPTGGSEADIFKEADALAQSHGLYTDKGAKVPLADAKKLREAIHKTPIYSSLGEKQKTSGHGLTKRQCRAEPSTARSRTPGPIGRGSSDSTDARGPMGLHSSFADRDERTGRTVPSSD